MILPDHVCPIHGPAECVVYLWKSGKVEKRCLACRREANNPTHNNGPRCRKAGHLKTPWTWRRYGKRQFGRCLTCQYLRQLEKKRTTDAETT